MKTEDMTIEEMIESIPPSTQFYKRQDGFYVINNIRNRAGKIEGKDFRKLLESYLIKEKVIMKFKTVNPHKDETYYVAEDDHSFVIKQGKNKVWISPSMIKWLAHHKSDIKRK